jgi:hypothetical protein
MIMNLSDIVFDAWISIPYVELPDSIDDMPAHTQEMCKQMRKKDTRLCDLTDAQLCKIIDNF